MSKQQQAMSDEDFLLAQEQALRDMGNQGQMQYSPTMFGGQNKQNLVEWELDFSSELANIERLVRCDVLERDREGNEYWASNPDKDAVVFNKKGVNDIIRQIILLVNKNKVLSYYSHDEIMQRVKLVGHELRYFIYNNYEEYGIDTPYKENNYPIIVLSILDVIEAAYRRAMNGETHKGLSEARVVQQNDSLQPSNSFNIYPQQQRKGSKIWPWNWGK